MTLCTNDDGATKTVKRLSANPARALRNELDALFLSRQEQQMFSPTTGSRIASPSRKTAGFSPCHPLKTRRLALTLGARLGIQKPPLHFAFCSGGSPPLSPTGTGQPKRYVSLTFFEFPSEPGAVTRLSCLMQKAQATPTATADAELVGEIRGSHPIHSETLNFNTPDSPN